MLVTNPKWYLKMTFSTLYTYYVLCTTLCSWGSEAKPIQRPLRIMKVKLHKHPSYLLHISVCSISEILQKGKFTFCPLKPILSWLLRYWKWQAIILRCWCKRCELLGPQLPWTAVARIINSDHLLAFPDCCRGVQMIKWDKQSMKPNTLNLWMSQIQRRELSALLDVVKLNLALLMIVVLFHHEKGKTFGTIVTLKFVPCIF